MPLTFLRNLGIVSSAGISTTKLGTGAVLQVITATDTTSRNTTSTSFVTASNTLSVSITPSSASNKVFVIVNTGIFKSAGGDGFLTIFRGATNLGGANSGMASLSVTGQYHSTAISYLDSPNTTSATTYQLYLRSSDANAFNITSNAAANMVSSITAFEIKG